jgi:twitching motility protein PilT
MFQGLDFSHAIPGVSRFRCNVYSHMATPAMVMRVVGLKVRTLEELKLPEVLATITLSLRGLTLLTGTTGSGKSTTLAAMIDLINSSYRCKIITIEDPVEYLHTNQKAMIAQLEVGQDTPSFEQGLRQALRQDPDVILVGELRDSETMRMALRAADTGHQVFATVHSSNAPQTIERILAMVPPEERSIATSQLASSLEAVISQRLAVTLDGNRRAAMEILRGGPVTSKYILENRLADLSEYIRTREGGMQRFDQHLLDLYHQKVISGTEAMRLATNTEAVALGLRGIH